MNTMMEELKQAVNAAIEFNTRDPFTESLIAGGFNGMKDVSCALMDIAEETGYSYTYLCEVFEDADLDEPIEETIAFISECALEGDL